MKIDNRFIENSFLGSLLLVLFYTDNITKGNVEKYYKKLHKSKHSLEEIVDYIEKDKKIKLNLSHLVLVSSKSGKLAPIFTSFVEHNGEIYLLPINPKKGYEGILEHIYDEDVEISTFIKEVEENKNVTN